MELTSHHYKKPLFREFSGGKKESRHYYEDGSSHPLRRRGEGLNQFSGLYSYLLDTQIRLSGSLATRAVLKGVGVGDDNATPLAATLTWLSRSGAGMLGQIVFVYFKGQELDSDPKKWRIIADILNDSAMAIEIVASYFSFPLVGVAGGATRTSITQHQARSNNISDVAAKDGSQETLVNLIGLILNLSILPIIPDNPLISLIFDTFNRERLSNVLKHYLEGQIILSPKICNRQEPVLSSHEYKHCFGYSICLGSSAQNHTDTIISKQGKIKEDGFIIIQDSTNKRIDVILSNDHPDLIRVYFEVFILVCNEKFNGITYEQFCEDATSSGWSLDKAQIFTYPYRIENLYIPHHSNESHSIGRKVSSLLKTKSTNMYDYRLEGHLKQAVTTEDVSILNRILRSNILPKSRLQFYFHSAVQGGQLRSVRAFLASRAVHVDHVNMDAGANLDVEASLCETRVNAHELAKTLGASNISLLITRYKQWICKRLYKSVEYLTVCRDYVLLNGGRRVHSDLPESRLELVDELIDFFGILRSHISALQCHWKLVESVYENKDILKLIDESLMCIRIIMDYHHFTKFSPFIFY
ncbi:RUS1 family protein homolog [Lepeophtheirus salmonis]|uniref:RUS1 family protein homolog n=1 Tax=Lepeophtheirus salmonis TaxID=72036 RepID=A0A7R8HCM7_LEPSM|nr:RUS1 family protein homolog [Lepeophtheirus salmonis]CAF3005348.1 RUS1 family protein homolog [Lepeophtheirus salmonis]